MRLKRIPTQTHTVNYRVGQSGRSPWLQVIASLPWFPPVDVAPEGGGDQVERDPGVHGTPVTWTWRRREAATRRSGTPVSAGPRWVGRGAGGRRRPGGAGPVRQQERRGEQQHARHVDARRRSHTETGSQPLRYILYSGVSLAGVSCRRRSPPPTTPAPTRKRWKYRTRKCSTCKCGTY